MNLKSRVKIAIKHRLAKRKLSNWQFIGNFIFNSIKINFTPDLSIKNKPF